jgi:hypothetical protein
LIPRSAGRRARPTHRSRRLLRAGLIVPLLAAAAAASCQIVAGVDGNFTLAPPDAGHDTGVGAGGAATDGGPPDAPPDTGPTGCVSSTYPDPPGGTDDGTDVGPIVVAVHSVDLGDTGGTVPGFDLDHTCTCIDDGGPSCVGSSMMTSLYCDVGGGVDNQFSKFIALAAVALPNSIGSSTFSTTANNGDWSLLLQIDGYNGKADDPAVTVSFLPAAGFGSPPKWDGSDLWPVLQTAFDASGQPLYVSNGAYVAGHTLVATVPTVPITFAGAKSTLTLSLSGAVLVGTLGNTNNVWRLQATLAARLGQKDLFAALSSYRDRTGAPLCTTSGFVYQTAKTTFCTDPDITLDSTLPPTAPCDAISFGMGVTADPAQVGPKVPVPMPTPGCPAGTDPSDDTCGDGG